jgi:hypothetical protein
MYPREYFSRNRIQEEPGFCFVLMPFHEGFGAVWERIRSTAESQEFNLQCRRADDFSMPGYVMEDVLRNIARASIVIADLTGRNPNVFYELGIAHSVKNASQVILLSQNMEFIPFDLRHFRSLIYREDLTDLAEGLSATLREIGVRQYRLVLSERVPQRFPARLSGENYFLYEVEVEAVHVGEDAAKVRLLIYRYAGRNEAEIVYDGIWMLGDPRPELDIPMLPWKLCYGGIESRRISLLLRRQNI